MKRNRIIAIILLFSSVIFLLGTISAFRIDRIINEQSDHLLENGVRTTAIVNSTDKETIRNLNPHTSQWYYMNDYYITFSYHHDGQNREGKIPALSDYLNGTKEKAEAGKLSDKQIVTNLTGKEMYESTKVGAKINIIYLLGQPESAQVLDEDGKLMTPNFFIFGVIALLLFLADGFVLLYYRKTGKTF